MRVASIFSLLVLFAIPAQALDVIYAHLAFKTADGKPYVETQYCILNGSLHFVKKADKSFAARYAVRLYFIDSDNDTVQSERFSLNSPSVPRPETSDFDLIDIRRNELPSGVYRIGLVVSDANGSESFSAERSLKLYFPTESMSFSSPLLIKRYQPSAESGTASYFQRGGYDMVPYPIAYFPDSIGNLTVYYEAYNVHKETSDTVLFRCSIRNAANENITDYTFTDRQGTDSLNIFFASMDLRQLKSGRYFLHLSALDRRENVLEETGFYFSRALQSKLGYNNMSEIKINEIFTAHLDRDSIWMWLGGLEHLANREEQNLIVELDKSKDTAQAQRFIYLFMQHRQPDDPQDAWLSYKKMFEEVEYYFATPVRHGYETDRGRIYMRYGGPDQRNVSTNEPGAYPYEVWQYYRVPNGPTNVFFVFYLPGLATNDYKLLHSNMNGETQDPRWKQKIYPMNQSADPDNTRIDDQYGRRIDSYLPH